MAKATNTVTETKIRDYEYYSNNASMEDADQW